MGVPGGGAAKRLVLEIIGWGLLLIGIAALVLPGPGLLCMFAGLAVLSQQYDWAERRVEPVRLRALQGAAEGVETWLRIVLSVLAALILIAFGVVWIAQPDSPSWWPLSDTWWLPGGIWTGVTQIGSGIFAIGLLIYSYKRFHGKPEARAALDREVHHDDNTVEAD
ncbi:MAG: PGPGW domain-containing protein [Nocardioides sp.]|nr:PGPGW domain-containing protein [Nocardioides sp.]